MYSVLRKPAIHLLVVALYLSYITRASAITHLLTTEEVDNFVIIKTRLASPRSLVSFNTSRAHQHSLTCVFQHITRPPSHGWMSSIVQDLPLRNNGVVTGTFSGKISVWHPQFSRETNRPFEDMAATAAGRDRSGDDAQDSASGTPTNLSRSGSPTPARAHSDEHAGDPPVHRHRTSNTL